MGCGRHKTFSNRNGVWEVQIEFRSLVGKYDEPLVEIRLHFCYTSFTQVMS